MPREHQVTFCYLREIIANDQPFPGGMENRNVCIFSTLPGGYLPCIESIEDYQLKISTLRRDYHHPKSGWLHGVCSPFHKNGGVRGGRRLSIAGAGTGVTSSS